MHQSVESDPVNGRVEAGRPLAGSLNRQPRGHEGTAREASKGGPAGRPTQQPVSPGQSVLDFIQAHPVVAAGAALAVGAAVVMVVNSRRVDNSRLDRRAMRAAQNMERSFAREMRNLRHSDFADRLGRVGNSFGDAFSRIDLSPLADLGKTYLEAARSKLGR